MSNSLVTDSRQLAATLLNHQEALDKFMADSAASLDLLDTDDATVVQAVIDCWRSHGAMLTRKYFMHWVERHIETKIERARLETVFNHVTFARSNINEYGVVLERLQERAERRGRVEYVRKQVLGGPMMLDTVEIKPIDWLWEKRIPLGNLSMIFGDGGCGKSQTTLYMAAQVSQGNDWLDGAPCRQGKVLLVTGEDSIASTVVPRLAAAGADLSKIASMPLVRLESSGGKVRQRGFTLGDMGALEETLGKLVGVRMVIIDPVSAFLNGADSHKDASVRELLTPLQQLAERKNIAVVMVAHVNKSRGVKAAQKVMGSAGFNNAVRSSFYAAPTRDGETFALAHAKANLAPMQSTLEYRIMGCEVTSGDTVVKTSKVDWLGETDTTADELLAVAEEPTTKVSEAKDFLREQLEDGNAKYATDLIASAQAMGISKRTLQRAKSNLKVRSAPIGFQGPVTWWLDGEDGEDGA
jgi:RecA-family ATPase